jgi:divalent metal cation (Fe/Co/Zn/Cd) transporter
MQLLRCTDEPEPGLASTGGCPRRPVPGRVWDPYGQAGPPPVTHHELPPDKHQLLKKAVRLEWLTIAYLLSAIVVLYLTLGNSRAMKAAWTEDILSLLPPIAFLIAARVRRRSPNQQFPYGSWSALPAVFLGRAKQPLARELHDKVLFADAEMNRADWLTAGAAMAGVVGIGFGLWWADAVAASIISLDITHDGYKNLKVAFTDLMDKEPTVADHSRPNPLPLWVANELRAMD